MDTGTGGSQAPEQNQDGHLLDEDRRQWMELLLEAPAGIAVLRGADHRFDWANPEFLRMVGKRADSVVGKALRESLPEVVGQGYLEMLDTVYRTGQSHFGRDSLARLDTEDGPRDVYANFACIPTRNALREIDGVLVHVTDVTETVLARRRIEESEKQFRTLAESIPNLAWMAHPDGHIFWYNRRWYEYTGTTPEQMEGWGWQSVHDPEVLPAVMTRWQDSINRGTPFEMVFPLRGADGEFRTFLTRIEPVLDSEGRVARWFGTNTDITAQQKTEEELRRTNRELEEFAYVASHDLQEPLRMVNIYTHLILKELGSPNPRLSEYAAFVKEGVSRMDALIRDLLTYSRTTHDDSPAGVADLSASLADAMSVLKEPIQQAGAIITTQALPSVYGDTLQLAHVFQNLLSNALKYHKPGGCPKIHIAAVHRGDEWIVSVRDNGIGFRPEYSERIFGLFRRLHKHEYPGTGLGLAICQRIVQRYGGRIWAEGRPNDGATFYFSLSQLRGTPHASHPAGGG